MPSPFPGMDPYLESPAMWMDFHESFITYCRDALIASLPDHYDARIEERINLVEVSDEVRRSFRADVAVSAAEDRGYQAAGGSPRDGGVLTVEPVTIPLTMFDEIHESNVHIFHREDQRLVTVVELLSPTNTSGNGYLDYGAKRTHILGSRVNLVEIDLLVGGQRLSLRRPLPRGDYYAFVCPGNRRPDCDVYAWSVRHVLPTIPIPLLPPDADLPLDLQELFTTTYERGRYRRSLKYSMPPFVALANEDLDWASTLAQSAAR